MLALGIHVDDLLAVVEEGDGEKVIQELCTNLVFSKWETDKFVFCGKDLVFDRAYGQVLLGQETFAKDIRVPAVPRLRRGQPDSELTAAELTELRSGRGCLQWLAGQSRPDLAAAVSLSQVPKPTVATLLNVNKLLTVAYKTADWKLRLQKVDFKDAILLVFTDASFGNAFSDRDMQQEESNVAPKDIISTASQVGYFVFLAEKDVLTKKGGRASLLDWRSTRAKRVCRSTLAAETQAADLGLDMGLYIRQMLAELILDGYSASRDRKLPSSWLPIVLMTDCRSLYDALTKDGAPSLPSEKRLAIDLASLADTADDYEWPVKELYRWLPTNLQLADYLTKHKPNADAELRD